MGQRWVRRTGTDDAWATALGLLFAIALSKAPGSSYDPKGVLVSVFPRVLRRLAIVRNKRNDLAQKEELLSAEAEKGCLHTEVKKGEERRGFDFMFQRFEFFRSVCCCAHVTCDLCELAARSIRKEGYYFNFYVRRGKQR